LNSKWKLECACGETPQMRPGRASILLDSMTEFVGLLEPDGRLLEANRAALDAVAVQRGDVVGRPFWETAWWQGLDEAQCRLRASVAEAAAGTFVRYDVEHWGQGGVRVLVVDFSLSPVRDSRGRIAYLVAEGRDITHRKRAEAEAHRKVSELEASNGRLAAEREARENYLLAASHDLRGLVQNVLCRARLLQDRLRDPSQHGERRTVERIADAACKMTPLVNEVIQSARVEYGRIEPSLRPVVLGSFIDDVVSASLEPLEAGRVRVDVPPSLPTANADPALLERVLLNLIGNALKYSAGEVCVNAAALGSDLCVSVSDRGPGITPEDLPHMFERYFRGRHGHASDGLGLGLFSVRMLVEAHGGRVWAESRGEGTTFRFTIPAAG
jgi:PAS domain S-box-containing protein